MFDTDTDTVLARAAERQELCGRLKELVVDRLDLQVDPAWVTDDQPLFGRGLGLDSVDALELVVAVEYDFGVAVSDDDLGVFGSINRLADYIESRVGSAGAQAREGSSFVS